MARSRCGWLLLPWIAPAASPAASSWRTILSAPCLVRLNTSARSTDSFWRNIVEQRRLFGLVHHGDALLDPLDRRRGRRDRDLGGIGQILVGEFLDRLRHGRREEQGLALRRDQGDDALQRVNEAEVEHLVGLVEDEDLELAQAEGPLVDEVEQAARRRDEDVETARDGAHALAVGNAAEDHADRQPHELAVGVGAGGDLRCKLARRRKHQHTDLARLRDVARGREAVERRQHEGRRLAGAGLRNAEEIAAGQDGRDGLALDRGGVGVIFRRERVEKGLGKPEVMKGHLKIPHMVRPREKSAACEGVKRAPRVNWRQVDRGAGRVLELPRPFTPLGKAPRAAVRYRGKPPKVQSDRLYHRHATAQKGSGPSQNDTLI